MTTRIIQFEKPKLKNPIFIEGLPGIGNVGRIAAGHLVEELKAKKFAELYSSHFMPFILLQKRSEAHLLKNEFYYWRGKQKDQRDLIILIGDSQSADPEGFYEICEEVLKYLQKLGVKEIFTLGGLSVGELVGKPKVFGVVNHPNLIEQYKNCGIDFEGGERIGTVVGASGLFVGLAGYYGMKAVCLLGETVGYPIIPDPKSAEAVLNALSKAIKMKIDTSKLEKRIREMEDFMKKIQEVQRKAIERLIKPPKPKKEELTYIG
jgi:uncharacterized protein (TIGR00162 family)